MTRFGTICYFGKTLKAFGYYLWVYFVLGKLLNLIGHIFRILGKFSLLLLAQYWRDNFRHLQNFDYGWYSNRNENFPTVLGNFRGSVEILFLSHFDSYHSVLRALDFFKIFEISRKYQKVKKLSYQVLEIPRLRKKSEPFCSISIFVQSEQKVSIDGWKNAGA